MPDTQPAGHGLALAMRVLWNLRVLGLFLVGPVAGVLLGGAIFGLPVDLRWAAAGMFLLSVAMFGVLIRGEWRRLSHARRAGAVAMAD